VVENYIAEHNLYHRIHVIHNDYNRGAMANIYRAVHLCHDTDLVVVLDGDDAFLHTNALATIERVHREYNCWVSYSQFMNLPEDKARQCGLGAMGYAAPTPAEIIKNKTYRQHPWCWSGLRCFDAWLFKQIRLEDLLDRRPGHEGEFFSVCCDNAYFFPLMEMAGEKMIFIPEPLLYRNVDTPLNDFKTKLAVDRLEIPRDVRGKRVYPTMTQPILADKRALEYSWADIVVCADSVEALPQALDSWLQAKGVGDIHVCYNHEDEAAIKKIQMRYPVIMLHNFDREPLSLVIQSLLGEYLVLTSTSQARVPFNITSAINLLKQTQALCFYLAYDEKSFFAGEKGILPVSFITNEVMACHCSVLQEINPSCCPGNRAGTLYRKNDIYGALQNKNLRSIELYDELFKQMNAGLNSIALLYQVSPF